MLQQMQRVGTPTFTVNRLANDIFRISTQAARSKVQKWMNTGLVAQVGEAPNPGNRPLNLYGVADPRLAIAMLPGQRVDQILEEYAFECPSCQAVQLTAEVEQSCTECGARFVTGETPSLLASLTLTDQ